MHRFRNPARVAGIGLTIALVAAACGTEVAPTVQAAETTGATESSAAAETSSDSAGGEQEAEGPAPVIDHLFPDVNTLNIVDGSTINLATELAGGDTPVLLWFWAPH